MVNDLKSVNVSFLLKDVLVKDIMANILDLARMSDMGERQFDQFERCIKDKIYTTLKEANTVINSVDKLTKSPNDLILPTLKTEKKD